MAYSSINVVLLVTILMASALSVVCINCNGGSDPCVGPFEVKWRQSTKCNNPDAGIIALVQLGPEEYALGENVCINMSETSAFTFSCSKENGYVRTTWTNGNCTGPYFTRKTVAASKCMLLGEGEYVYARAIFCSQEDYNNSLAIEPDPGYRRDLGMPGISFSCPNGECPDNSKVRLDGFRNNDCSGHANVSSQFAANISQCYTPNDSNTLNFKMECSSAGFHMKYFQSSCNDTVLEEEITSNGCFLTGGTTYPSRRYFCPYVAPVPEAIMDPIGAAEPLRRSFLAAIFLGLLLMNLL